MRVLVFGKTGQLAQELASAGAVMGLEMRLLGREQADLADPESCAAAISGGAADIVINAAAQTDIERAQVDEPRANLINAHAPRAMAAAAAQNGVPFLHVSTDYVFDGLATGRVDETAETVPVNAYGRSKLLGELGVAAAGGKYAVLRTAWVFSKHGKGFVNAIIAASARGDNLNVVDDQIGGPTPAYDVAQAILSIAAAFHQGQGVSGVFHFSGTPKVSRATLARRIFSHCAARGEISSVTSREYSAAAPRPAQVELNCRKISEVYGILQPDWRGELKKICVDSGAVR